MVVSNCMVPEPLYERPSGFGTCLLHIDFKGDYEPWEHNLPLNGREIERIIIDGAEYFPYTGAERDMFFILPKPKEGFVQTGPVQVVCDGPNSRAELPVDILGEALAKWRALIDADIQRHVFETFIAPQDDERGKFIEINGERYERTLECENDSDFGNSFECSICGWRNYDSYAADKIRRCPGCGSFVGSRDA